MLSRLICLLFFNICLVLSQTPPVFIYQPKQSLTVDYNGKVLEYPGQVFHVTETLTKPEIGIKPDSDPTGPYVLIMADPSLNNDNGHTVYLHLIQANYSISSTSTITTSNGIFNQLISSSDAVAEYLIPTPPPFTGTHEYVVLVFPQPEGFTVPGKYDKWFPDNDLSRFNFPLAEFVDETRLGEVLAGNYFNESAV